MKLGRYNIPEVRITSSIEDIRMIQKQIKDEQHITSDDIAASLNFKEPKGGAYYRRFSALVSFGLLENNGNTYRITEQGQRIIYSSDEELTLLITESVLNVELWKELYSRFKKSIPPNFASHLKNILNISYAEAAKNENTIKTWYLKDIAFVIDDGLVEKELNENLGSNQKEFSSNGFNYNKDITSMQRLELQKNDDNDNQTNLKKIEFGENIRIYLPKKDLERWWQRAIKYMELYLEEVKEKQQEEKEPLKETASSST